MRLTFVLPGYPYVPIGGFRIVYEYANELTRRGHHVSVVHAIFPDTHYGPLSPTASLRRRLWRYVSLFKAIRFTGKIEWQKIDPRVELHYQPWGLDESQLPDADFIFATAWNTAQPVHQLSLTKGEHCYLIQHWESWPPASNDAVVSATWRLPLHKLVISQWLYAKGIELGLKDMIHIPNAIDFDEFSVLSPPASRPLSVIALNHPEPWKGTADALDAFKMLHDSHPNIPVAMFGTQPKPRHFPGWIRYFENPSQQSLVRDVYNGHAIYLGASWAEGWGLPPAEAMACGCAFVGTNVGGYRDFAIHGETALLSAPKNPEGLYKNLLTLIQNAQLRRKIQTQGTAYIQRFTWSHSGHAMEEWLQSILPKGDGPRATADLNNR